MREPTPSAGLDDPLVPEPGTRLRGQALGIDIGGTGVKAALVDLTDGSLVSDRIREKTPQPSTPEAVAATVASVVGRVLGDRRVAADMPVGCGLPGVIKAGRVMTAANIDQGWVGVSAEEVVGAALGKTVRAINDADAAGIAEIFHGAARDVPGTVLVLTIGTGIGSALFVEGRLVPNTEFGHIELKGKDAESQVSGAARDRRGMGWRRWAREFDLYLEHMETYLWPDLIILGGGVSKELPRFGKWLEARAPVRAALHLNASGIIGAAVAAAYAAKVTRPSAGRRASGARRIPASASPASR